MRRIAIYTRVSTANQGIRATSLDDQVAHCVNRAIAHDDDIVAVYREVRSVQDLERRPQLAALRAVVKAGEIDVVLIYAIDRLTRNVAHLHFLTVEFGTVGCALELATEEFATTPIAKLLQAVRAFVAETELLRLRERCIRGKRARAERGLLPTNRLPYGYRWRDAEKQAAVPDERTAPIAVAVFAAAAGTSLNEIAHALNAAAIPTPRAGRAWTVSSLRRLLHNPAYKGDPVALRTATVRTRDGRSRAIARPSAEWVLLPATLVPPLISRDVWDRVATLIASRQKHRGIDRVSPEHFLLARGIVRCGLCGQAMVARGEQEGAQFYRCPRSPRGVDACGRQRVDADSLDRRTWDRVVRTAAIGGPPRWTRRAAKWFVRLDDNQLTATQEEVTRMLTALSEALTRTPGGTPGDVVILTDLAVAQGRLQDLRERLALIGETWTALGNVVATNPGADDLTWSERRSWLDRLEIVVSIWPRGTGRLYEVASVVAGDERSDRQSPRRTGNSLANRCRQVRGGAQRASMESCAVRPNPAVRTYCLA